MARVARVARWGGSAKCSRFQSRSIFQITIDACSLRVFTNQKGTQPPKPFPPPKPASYIYKEKREASGVDSAYILVMSRVAGGLGCVIPWFIKTPDTHAPENFTAPINNKRAPQGPWLLIAPSYTACSSTNIFDSPDPLTARDTSRVPLIS